jgi:hypothetical protein
LSHIPPNTIAQSSNTIAQAEAEEEEEEVMNAVLQRLEFPTEARSLLVQSLRADRGAAASGGGCPGTKRILVYENQRAGGAAEALTLLVQDLLDHPEERLFSSTKLERTFRDPQEWCVPCCRPTTPAKVAGVPGQWGGPEAQRVVSQVLGQAPATGRPHGQLLRSTFRLGVGRAQLEPRGMGVRE